MASSSGRLTPGLCIPSEVSHPLQPLSRAGVLISSIRHCSREYPPFVSFPNLTDGCLRGVPLPSNLHGSVSDVGTRGVDHFQQCTYVAPDIYPYQAPVVSGANDQGGYGNHHPCFPSPPSLPLPFPGSLHSPLPIPGYLSPPPEMPPHHTRPFHEGKDETFKVYHIQSHEDSFQEQDAGLKQRYLKSPSPSKKTLSDRGT